MKRICTIVKDFIEQTIKKLIPAHFKITVIGEKNSGKTQLVKLLFQEKADYLGRINDANVYKYCEDNVKYFIYDVDTNHATKWDHYYKECDVLIYCVNSANEEKKWDSIKNELHSFIYRNMWPKKNILFLGTKNDEPSAVTCKELISSIDLYNIKNREISCISISSKNKSNICYVDKWIKEQSEKMLKQIRIKWVNY